MALWRDEKYLRLLSPQLDRFTQKHSHTYNFRCPLCGDSEKMRSKARGYVYPKEQTLMFKCHNCSIALPFSALLKRMSVRLYDEYILERLRDEGKQGFAPDAPKKAPESPVVDVHRANHVMPLPLVKALGGALQPVLDYVVNRGIPETAFPRLYATRAAQTWLSPLVDSKAKVVEDDVPYLVMPMCLPDGTWYGAQLRPVDHKAYPIFRWSHDPLKVFGLDAWKPGQLTYVVEGPIDSLFVPNALAAMGSDLLGAAQILHDLNYLPHTTPRVYVWDNEPRNKDVARHVKHAVSLHESVVIWPPDYPKDINDMTQAGIDVTTILPSRTYTGLMADLKYSEWKR